MKTKSKIIWKLQNKLPVHNMKLNENKKSNELKSTEQVTCTYREIK